MIDRLTGQVILNSCLFTLLILIKRENCWSKLKEWLQTSKSRTYQELAQAIKLVSEKDITGWFTQCCYYVLSN